MSPPDQRHAPLSRNVLIHIGKCGGSTCRTAIETSQVPIHETVHIYQPVAAPDARYFIIARAPLARALSAFNWRHRLVHERPEQAARFPGEKAIITHYGTLNALAEALYFSDGTPNALALGNFRSIHHLGESIAFYLDPLLHEISPDQIGGVIMQETLQADLEAVFGVTTAQRTHANHDTMPPEMLHLSPLARSHLRRALAGDFACLATLQDWGVLNPACLDILQSEEP
ncbi:MAG: hypothetical protein AAF891_10740 [Pseudomonadota bacterium]